MKPASLPEPAEVVEASDGTRIRLELGRELVVVAQAAKSRHFAALPFPTAGLGGYGFVLSPSERWLAFTYYSGQSEEAYHLMTLPDLELRWSLPYVFGESGLGLPRFTPDETKFVTAWAINPGLIVESHAARIHRGELPPDARTSRAHRIEWGRVHVRELATGATQECAMHVQMPVGSVERRDPESWPRLSAAADDWVVVDTGWGDDVRIALPPPTAVLIEGPPPGR
ncbi:MAG: hypothetical protein AAF447_28145 [Myxococcota bacterium]